MVKTPYETKDLNVKAFSHEPNKDVSEILDFLEGLRELEKKYHKHNMDKIDKWLHEEDN